MTIAAFFAGLASANLATIIIYGPLPGMVGATTVEAVFAVLFLLMRE